MADGESDGFISSRNNLSLGGDVSSIDGDL